jgi:carbonic anhydrase
VLAVLLEAPPSGQQQPAVNPCLAAGQATVPSTPGESATCSTPVHPADLLPTGPSLEQYVAYRGSLTTPPCSEGVDWLVWTQPVLVPQQQVQQFKAFAGMNSRPVQPLNQRAVASNCITAA